MVFPVDLVSTLSGASLGQLQNWRATDLLVPEISRRPRALYSFRDVVALRTMVRLRSQVSLQKIRAAFNTLREFDLTEHPSSYELLEHDNSIFLVHDDEGIDLVKRKGQRLLMTLDDVFSPFQNLQGNAVVDFRRPAPDIAVREQRMGGWPTIDGTRVGYDTVANLQRGDDPMTPEEVNYFYPTVSPTAAEHALAFDTVVRERKRG